MNKEVKFSGLGWLFCLIVGVMATYIIRYSIGDYYNYISVGGATIIVFLVIVQQHRLWMAEYLQVVGRIIFFFAIMFSFILFTSPNIVLDLKYLGVLMTCFIPILIYQFVDCNMKNEQKKFVLKIGLCIWSYYCVKAIIFYVQNSSAARQLASSPDYYGDIAIGGGYYLAYGSAILAVYLFERIWYGQRNFLTLALFMLCVIVVILTDSSITTLSMMAGIAIAICKKLVCKFQINITLWLFWIIIFGGLFYFSGAYHFVLNAIYEIFVPIQKPYAWRIVEVVKLLLGEGIVKDGAIWLRGIVYKNSIDIFLENPIFGQLMQSSLFVNDKIGGHSELLDSLAQWGLLFGGFYLSIYYYAIKSCWRNITCKTYVVVFVFLMCLNPVRVFHTMFVMFLLIPLYEKVSEKADEGIIIN